jgi:hypothetical protein
VHHGAFTVVLRSHYENVTLSHPGWTGKFPSPGVTSGDSGVNCPRSRSCHTARRYCAPAEEKRITRPILQENEHPHGSTAGQLASIDVVCDARRAAVDRRRGRREEGTRGGRLGSIRSLANSCLAAAPQGQKRRRRPVDDHDSLSITATRSLVAVPGAGFEPARPYCGQRILSPLRLPFRHPGLRGVHWRAWRLGAESNRCTRLCRPLHHHSAT